MADMVSARSLQVLQQNEKELILAEGGNRLAVLNRSERLAEEKERMLRECGLPCAAAVCPSVALQLSCWCAADTR
jgi:hypothetical protein